MLNPQAQPEADFLTLCSRRALSHFEAARLRRYAVQPLDWTFIVREGDRHGVLPLVHANLQAHGCMERIPVDPRRLLQARLRETAGRNLAFISELVRILRLFTAADIAALPFKGPMVAMAAYGDCLLRSFGDLDILVHPEDMPRARRILAEAGYDEVLHLTPGQERAYLKAECALQFQDHNRGFVVELHWRFSERNASIHLPLDCMWKRSTTLCLGGLPVPTLGLEDLLLYLSVHGAKHCWERLEWIACVAELIRRHPELDLEVVLRRAREHRIARLLHLALTLAAEMLETPLPVRVQQELDRDRWVRMLAATVRSQLFAASSGTRHQQRASRYLFMLRSREHWLDKIGILLLSALKPPHPDSEEWINLPPRLAFLQYVVRPVRLMSQYGAVVWRRYSEHNEPPPL